MSSGSFAMVQEASGGQMERVLGDSDRKLSARRAKIRVGCAAVNAMQDTYST